MTVRGIARSPVVRTIACTVFGLSAGLLFGWDLRRPVPPPGPGRLVALLLFAVFLAVGRWVLHKPLPALHSRMAKGFLGGAAVGMLVSAAFPDTVLGLGVVLAALVFSRREIAGDPLPSNDRTSQR